MSNDELILKLHDIGAVKFGSFKLKSGILSPIYLDIRLIISYPDLLSSVASAMWNTIKDIEFDIVCGVPYTAIPIATTLSIHNKIPMIIRRKEAKDYGTRKSIEGKFQKGDRCLVIEDLVTSGSSVFETIDPLEHEGLKVKDIVVLIDREQGGKQNIEQKGYTLHSVFTLKEILHKLELEERISSTTKQEVLNFIHENQIRSTR